MKKVIIIGAGPAGLGAAYELLKNGKCEVTILEASHCIGGLARNAKFHENIIDIGGHRFFTKNNRVKNVWNTIMDDEHKDWLLRPRYSRIYYSKKFISYPIKLSYEMLKTVGFKNVVEIGASYFYSVIRPKEETNLENLYINQFGEKLYRMFFRDYTIKACGKAPNEISAAWGHKRVQKLSIKKIAESEFRHKTDEPFPDTEDFHYPRYGAGELWEKLAAMIKRMGGKIILGAEVKKIFIENKRINSILCNEDGQAKFYHADEYISSMALNDLGSALSCIPDKIKKYMTELPYRSFVTFSVQIPKDKFLWGSDIKDTWVYIQQEGIKMGRIQIYNNWSPDLPADGNDILIGAEYFCFENDEFWNMSEEKAFDFAANELIKLKVIKSKDSIIGLHREKIEKAYPGYYGSYSQLAEIKKYLASVVNLSCVGRNGLHAYLNMDEAMLSGMETADYIAESLWKSRKKTPADDQSSGDEFRI